ncbi:hypothetical protein PVAND_008006 [Polypedilum vanderplanki]|uniref:Chitin-binding type-4 domain-containing protein n=1 Tax=Polypedilum vanderplanki TaxID=319348 RepID=A0A9J6C8C9_POLVA|nr:hypothetical protein PVAND_008006 [Polypedilum vanderplanki]
MKKFFFTVIVVVTLIFNFVSETSGHGYVSNPPGRSSRWRTKRTAPVNYDDNGSNCGGFANQWTTWKGKCGICGDPYQDPVPRRNEIGGIYGGTGVIVASYTKGSVIEVTVKITANHLGKFIFDLCNLDEQKESDECFEKYRLTTPDGRNEYPIGSSAGDYMVKLQLPKNLKCNHCVLRWTYICGNNWGWCPDGIGRLGCGPQENFRTCSDISIA